SIASWARAGEDGREVGDGFALPPNPIRSDTVRSSVPGLGVDIMTEKKPVTRRSFLETAGVATGAVVAAGTFAHPAVAKVKGANERLNFAILGPGGRAQAHIGHLLAMKKEGRNVDILGVCDVWDGYDGEVTDWDGQKKTKLARGLYPSAKRCGLDPSD